MNDTNTIGARPEIGESLAFVVEDLARRFEEGESIDIEAIIAMHPEHEAALRQLLPAMTALAQFGNSNGAALALDALAGATDESGRLGDFRIIREIGRGGMGVVYEAEQISLGRRVALKVLPFAGVLDERQLKRFKLEAAAAAALKHPNIVSVYCVGCERGVHFYAMEYIEGQSLAAVILECCVLSQLSLSNNTAHRKDVDGETTSTKIQSDDKSSHSIDTVADALSTLHTARPRDYFRRIAEIGIQAADALEHAHQMGIVHRDIKPANLLLDHEGKLSITDFGLARLSTDAGMTLTGDMLGTLRYMSPEQASGAKLLDERTDIYSLGVTLYELAALRPAFSETDRQKLIRQVVEQEPPLLRAINPRMPADLETIIHKAMAKDPADRYATAKVLASDLAQLRDDKPILARRPSLAARGRRFVRRHPGPLIGALSALAVLLVVTSVSFFAVADEKEKTKTSLDEKTVALQKSEASLRIAREAVDSLYVDLGGSWMANHSKESAVQREFLHRAARFYEDLVQEAEDNPDQLRATATAYARIGEIRNYLRQSAMTVRALETSIALGHKLVQGEDCVEDDRIELSRRYRQLHDVLLDLGQVKEAGESLSKGWKYIESLSEANGGGQKRNAELAAWLQYRAAAALRQDELEQAERLALDAIDFTAQFLHSRSNPELEWLANKSRGCLAESLLAQDRLADARKHCEEALRRCRIARVGDNMRESRPLTELEITITALLADIDSAQERYPEAADHYRQSLALLREEFEDRKSPAVLSQDMFTTSFGGDGDWKGTYDPEAFCTYAEIQIKLAQTLIKLGRHHEAECQLGEVYTPIELVINITGRKLRYDVALANAYAVAAELCRDWLPAESPLLLDTAVYMWHVAAQDSKVAAKFKSGVHGRVADLDWFRTTFGFFGELPTHDKRQGRHVGPAKHHYSITRAQALANFNAGQHKDSAAMFPALGDKRETNNAFDWLYVAMSHAHLRQHDEAQHWYIKSVEDIAASKDAPAELLELRDVAKQLIEEKRADKLQP